jgi:hypothetical protein
MKMHRRYTLNSECAGEARAVPQWQPGHNCRYDRDRIEAHHKTLPGRDFRPYCVLRGEFRIARQHLLKGEIERMDSTATYFHWGFILISVPNLLVIVGMIVLFAVALVAPFPHGGEGEDGRH